MLRTANFEHRPIKDLENELRDRAAKNIMRDQNREIFYGLDDLIGPVRFLIRMKTRTCMD